MILFQVAFAVVAVVVVLSVLTVRYLKQRREGTDGDAGKRLAIAVAVAGIVFIGALLLIPTR